MVEGFWWLLIGFARRQSSQQKTAQQTNARRHSLPHCSTHSRTTRLRERCRNLYLVRTTHSRHASDQCCQIARLFRCRIINHVARHIGDQTRMYRIWSRRVFHGCTTTCSCRFGYDTIFFVYLLFSNSGWQQYWQKYTFNFFVTLLACLLARLVDDKFNAATPASVRIWQILTNSVVLILKITTCRCMDPCANHKYVVHDNNNIFRFLIHVKTW